MLSSLKLMRDLKNINMNWKERREWMKVAKLKRMEAMAHGEIKLSKVREKYDVYLVDKDNEYYADFTTDELYTSYDNLGSVMKLAIKIVKESPLYYGDSVCLNSNPKLINVRVFTTHRCYILLDDDLIECSRISAEYTYECHDENDIFNGPDYNVDVERDILYYVDDSFEL